MDAVSFYIADESFAPRGQAIAASTGLKMRVGFPDDGRLCLFLDANGLSLCGDGMTMLPDLSEDAARLRPNNLGAELIVKAARPKTVNGPLRAVDATAGLGADALLLAAAGFEVTMFEYNPIIAALLSDALERAENSPGLCGIVPRMHLITGDSVAGLQALDFVPDAVLLDPMFPERQKSAQTNKKFQLMHRLESPCSNEEELLAAAMATGAHRIVVKRPVKGPCLGSVKPSFSLAGKAVRVDCIVRA